MRYLPFLVLMLIAASCATPRTEVPLLFEPPDAFSSDGESALADAWWESFGDASLNGFMAQALSNNLSLRATWDRLAQAEATARRQGADIYPSLDIVASATSIDRDEGRAEEYSGGLVASYELDIWGRVRSTREAASLDVAATAAQLRAAAITLSAEIANAWFQRAEQAGQLNLLEQQLATSEKSLEILRSRFRSGQSSAVDVLQQEQLVEARRGDMSSARARLAVLENQLAILAGQSAGSAIPEPAAWENLPPAPETGLPADLLQRRPDVLRAYHLVLAADERAAAALADRFPRFSISARYTSTEAAASDLFSNWITTLAANLVAPVIDGGAKRAEVERARAALSEAINTYGQTVLTALSEVENALVREQHQRELLDSLHRQLELATQVTDQTRERYLRGIGDFLRVLTAELSQQNLERNVLAAERELREFRVALCRALSGGFDLERPSPATLDPTVE